MTTPLPDLLRYPDGTPLHAKQIARDLAEIDPDLGLTICPMEDLGSLWAVTLKWRPDDPRREEVKMNARAEEDAYDIITWLPRDCPPEQAKGYLMRTLRRRSGRDDIRQLLNKVHEHNERARKAALQSTAELAEELIQTNRRTLSPGLGRVRRSSKDERDFRHVITDTNVEEIT